MASYPAEQDGSSPGLHIPPIINPPPAIFGGSDSNGSPPAPDLGGVQFFVDDPVGGTEESHEAKRRRVSRACDVCRKKKIKCDGRMPKCSHCISYKVECIFTHVEKKRNPPKGAKYIESLENRLGRMESLLKLSGLLNDEDEDKDLGTLEKRLAPRVEKQLTPNSSTDSPEPPKVPEVPEEEEVEALSDMMCSLVTNNCGESRYIGSSSGFSIFSPKGIQWVNEKTGDNSFQEMISSAAADDNKWVYWKPEIFNDIFSRREFVQLPPRDEALSLLKDFFENFNCMFPLFHEPTFMHLVNRHYSRNPYEGSGWWASLNIALAIAHRLRVMSNLVPQEEDNKAWAFLKNAMGVLTELTMRNTDLLSVQALLGMALFLLGTPNPQPSFFLVAAAIRLAHSIGLHKRGSWFNLNPVEIEQRKRVFWIAYLVDKDICLRSGRPPAQDDDDMNVELPSEDPIDNIGNIPLADGKGKTNLFRLMCTFAVIESKVYKQLYSTKASKQSDGALLNTIGELDKELEDWKDGIPLDFRPEHEIKASHTPLILHVVVLHFAYYNCLTTIHRMSVHHGYWTSRLSDFAIKGLNARPLNPRVFSSAALCVAAARASINLIKYIPHGDFSCVWLILYFPVSALVTLFANILQNPQDSRARTDVKLMNQVVNFLTSLTVSEEHSGVRRTLGVCAEFERIARVVLEKAEKESHSRRKRKNKEIKEVVPVTAPAPNTPPPQARSPQSIAFTTPDPPLLFNNQSYDSSPFKDFSPQIPNNKIPNPLGFNSTSPSAYPSHLDPNMNGQLSPDFSQKSNDLSHNQYASSDGQAYPSSDGPSPLSFNNMGSFDQPFVPQDLWQMPMTLEWDWADLTGIGDQGIPYSGDPQYSVLGSTFGQPVTPNNGGVPGQVP